MQGVKVLITWLHEIAALVVDAVMTMTHTTKQTKWRALGLAMIDESIGASRLEASLVIGWRVSFRAPGCGVYIGKMCRHYWW